MTLRAPARVLAALALTQTAPLWLTVVLLALLFAVSDEKAVTEGGGGSIPIRSRGKFSVPISEMIERIPLCVPADPFGRMRSFPRGRSMSS